RSRSPRVSPPTTSAHWWRGSALIPRLPPSDGGASLGGPHEEAAMSAGPPVEMVSDVVCPWGFLGKRRVGKAVAVRRDIAVEVRFWPYFLNPWVPREGISRKDYLSTKFGSPERYRSIAQRVAQAAAAEGLTYNLDSIKRQPNTLDCHRLILWAGETG